MEKIQCIVFDALPVCIILQEINNLFCKCLRGVNDAEGFRVAVPQVPSNPPIWT